MNFLEKLDRVKDNLAKWQDSWGTEFNYLINEYATENEDLGTTHIYISKQEHRSILKYLSSTGFLEMLENGSDSTKIKILPPKKPIIRLKSLELIALDIGELDTGTNLVDFLVECGVNKKLIVYPNTKWRMVYAVLVELATSKSKKDKKTLYKIIRSVVHPLMNSGDEIEAEGLKNKFNALLKYDSLQLVYDKSGGDYELLEYLTKKEQEEEIKTLEKEEENYQKFLNKPENKEKISLLRKNYQVLMGVIEVYCRNYLKLPQEEIIKLNKIYLALDKTVWRLIDELKLGDPFNEAFVEFRKYPRPFKNLFSAEKELGVIDWDMIRRETLARFGEIESLHLQVNASDVLSEPNKQKWLNDITLYLSELKTKTESARRGTNKAYNKQPNLFELEVKDRKILVNSLLIAQPHAVGSNLEFFEYVRKQSPNTKIQRKELDEDLQEDLSRKNFHKILNALGFKGEIKKAFFYKVDKNSLFYRGNKLTLNQLKKNGLNVKLFIKQLEAADAKYNPN